MTQHDTAWHSKQEGQSQLSRKNVWAKQMHWVDRQVARRHYGRHLTTHEAGEQVPWAVGVMIVVQFPLPPPEHYHPLNTPTP